MKITLRMTCGACPEQYDAVSEDGTVLAYLRLRHGVFTVEAGGPGGTMLLQADPNGDGVFDPDERDYYLSLAARAVRSHYFMRGPDSNQEQYTIEGDD